MNLAEQRADSAEYVRYASLHEAGHVVCAMALRCPVQLIAFPTTDTGELCPLAFVGWRFQGWEAVLPEHRGDRLAALHGGRFAAAVGLYGGPLAARMFFHGADGPAESERLVRGGRVYHVGATRDFADLDALELSGTEEEAAYATCVEILTENRDTLFRLAALAGEKAANAPAVLWIEDIAPQLLVTAHDRAFPVGHEPELFRTWKLGELACSV